MGNDGFASKVPSTRLGNEMRDVRLSYYMGQTTITVSGTVTFHYDIDTVRIHVPDPAFAEVSAELDRLPHRHRRGPVTVARSRDRALQPDVGRFPPQGGLSGPHDLQVDGVFFDADDFHGERFLREC